MTTVRDKRKGFAPEKALAKLDAIAASEEVKEVVRAIPLRSARPSLAAPAPAAAAAIAAPAIDPDYAEEAPIVTPAAKTAKPKAEPVKATSELEAKLDSLFG